MWALEGSVYLRGTMLTSNWSADEPRRNPLFGFVVENLSFCLNDQNNVVLLHCDAKSVVYLYHLYVKKSVYSYLCVKFRYMKFVSVQFHYLKVIMVMEFEEIFSSFLCNSGACRSLSYISFCSCLFSF